MYCVGNFTLLCKSVWQNVSISVHVHPTSCHVSVLFYTKSTILVSSFAPALVCAFLIMTKIGFSRDTKARQKLTSKDISFTGGTVQLFSTGNQISLEVQRHISVTCGWTELYNCKLHKHAFILFTCIYELNGSQSEDWYWRKDLEVTSKTHRM